MQFVGVCVFLAEFWQNLGMAPGRETPQGGFFATPQISGKNDFLSTLLKTPRF